MGEQQQQATTSTKSLLPQHIRTMCPTDQSRDLGLYLGIEGSFGFQSLRARAHFHLVLLSSHCFFLVGPALLLRCSPSRELGKPACARTGARARQWLWLMALASAFALLNNHRHHYSLHQHRHPAPHLLPHYSCCCSRLLQATVCGRGVEQPRDAIGLEGTARIRLKA